MLRALIAMLTVVTVTVTPVTPIEGDQGQYTQERNTICVENNRQEAEEDTIDLSAIPEEVEIAF